MFLTYISIIINIYSCGRIIKHICLSSSVGHRMFFKRLSTDHGHQHFFKCLLEIQIPSHR